jgi:hypothetical protein
MMNEEGLAARSLLEFLTIVNPKIRTKEKRGIYARKDKQTRLTSKASNIRHTKVSATIYRDYTECL